MSVPVYKRRQSKTEYVNVAYQLNLSVLELVSRLSARYSRLLAEDIKKLATAVITECECADSIVLRKSSASFDSDYVQRRKHLLEARGQLLALDVQLGICFEILEKNPQGGFSNSKGYALSASDAEKKLDRLATECGDAVGQLIELLEKVIKADVSKFSSKSLPVIADELPDYDISMLNKTRK